MSDILRGLAERPWVIVSGVAVVILWNAAWFAWRLRTLRRRGETLLAQVPEGSLFVEKWTSGASRKTFWTGLGGANNCLLVALGRERLRIRPHGLFFLLAERFDLDHDVSLAEIAGLRIVNGLVHLDLPGRVFVLRLRDPEKFLGVWKLVRGV